MQKDIILQPIRYFNIRYFNIRSNYIEIQIERAREIIWKDHIIQSKVPLPFSCGFLDIVDRISFY